MLTCVVWGLHLGGGDALLAHERRLGAGDPAVSAVELISRHEAVRPALYVSNSAAIQLTCADLYTFCIFFIVIIFNLFIFVIESGYIVSLLPSYPHTAPSHDLQAAREVTGGHHQLVLGLLWSNSCAVGSLAGVYVADQQRLQRILTAAQERATNTLLASAIAADSDGDFAAHIKTRVRKQDSAPLTMDGPELVSVQTVM